MEDKTGFECVRPIESHARQIMEWRNDPLTLRMSYHSQPKVWEQFYPEFTQNYFSLPDLPPYFILDEGRRVGFVRFSLVNHPNRLPHRRCCEVSINVAPDQRGKGIAVRALLQLKPWAARQGYDDIYAEVKKENVASQEAFHKAGYAELQGGIKRLETGESFEIKRYLAQLSPYLEEAKSSVFVIAEAGSNWRMGSADKDLAMAKKMIDAAAKAGADAVKFQTFNPSSLYVQGAGQANYLKQAGIQEDILELLNDLAMPHEMIPELAGYCQERNIEFMSTPFSHLDFEAVDPFVKRHKIASYEINHIRLIELAAKSQKPLILSTGAATEGEIAWAVEEYRRLGGQELTLMQCTACYPAVAESLNLKVIPWLKYRFNAMAGLSDHSRHPAYAPAAAVALGAVVIEKHFTMDQSLPGPDHAFALNPSELNEMIQTIRATEAMLGSGVKTIQDSELELRAFAQRGIQAIKEINAGDVLQEGVNIDILRPGRQPKGLHSKFLKEMEGKIALHSIKRGTGIQKGDWPCQK